ncbi:CoA transferase [Cryptosporangium aurantiacum]|uniref:Crotonobetainyl-CoA:carnitine CoA-transferase CaiB n=1 Tax=Cryptosporangium aurantiacum TaxID=134849 RepID=A0A1M7RP93_9ACTN|nr:CoA transferase [Cryptosporangium aurantiacum]SHN47922.1 Crotonobetainyl-CoA:carnitine CoA-transferase CaiB [Cryptosporangium aurantiacum]
MTAVRPLGGLAVAELDSSLALAFCGKYLAGLGADVTAYGPRLADYDNAVRDYVDDGKRMSTDPRPTGSLGDYDIVLASDVPSGLPDHVVVVVVTDQGRTGPQSTLPGGDFLAQARSGLMSLVGVPDQAPLALGGHQIEYSAGLAAFTGAMVALHQRDKDGRGQVVETSLLEVAAYIEWKGRMYHQVGNVLTRGDRSGPIITECSDGQFGFYYRATDWPAILRVFGSERLDDPRFAGHPERVRHSRELVEVINELSAGLTRDELYHRLQAVGVPAGPIYTPTDLLRSEQYRQRGFLVPLDSAGPESLQPALPVTFNGARSAAPYQAVTTGGVRR